MNTYPLIGLMGQKRSGKDTAASILVRDYGYVRYAYADPMKQAAYALDPLIGEVALPGALTGVKRLSDIVDALGWERAKECPEVRRTLQRLGTEVGRNHFGDSFWVDLTMSQVADAEGPVVITDARFPNEADAIRRAGGIIVEVRRPGLPDEDGHASEHAWRSVRPNAVLDNDGTVEDLEERIRAFARFYL